MENIRFSGARRMFCLADNDMGVGEKFVGKKKKEKCFQQNVS